MAAPTYGSMLAPWPVSSTYNSVDLNASVAFMIEYMGAEVITPNLTAATAGCDSAMQWVLYGLSLFARCCYVCLIARDSIKCNCSLILD